MDGVARPTVLRVVVAEDSLLMRAGVVRVLESADMEIVGEATDADELLRQVRAHRPDVVIVDVRMPPDQHDEGLRAAGTTGIRAELPDVGILVLSQDAQEGAAFALLGEDATGVGYLLKDRVLDTHGFCDAVREVADGGLVLDPAVVAQLFASQPREGPLQRLSPRERDVLARMAEGQSNLAIAEGLALSERVVERHVSAIFTKLDLASGPDGHRRVLAVLAWLRSS
jgi:DNA-binding NarL/FixJ family response regulator